MSDQLIVEREGLEKKDKGELQAIVSALGGSSSARMRKAELIDQILELSGASTGGAASDDVDEGEDEQSDSASGEADTASDDTEEEAEADAESADDDRADNERGDQDRADNDRGDDDRAEADAEDGGSFEGGGSSDRGTKTRRDSSGSKESAVDHPVGPDGEPLADWEIKILEEGGQLDRGRPKRGQRNNNGGGRGQRNQEKGGRGDKSREGKDGNSGRGQNDGSRNDKNDKGDKNDKNDKNDRNDKGAEGSDGDEGDPNNRRSRRRGRGRGRDRDDAGNEPISVEPIEVNGFLDLRDEGYAFLRVNGCLPSRDDAYVSVKQVRQFGLRKGDHVTGLSRPANRNEKNPALQQLDTLNGKPPEESKRRPRFDNLTPLFPNERLVLESKDEPLNMTNRIIDLVAPIGKGQRGLIVSPPKAGKTAIMKNIASAIEANNPDVELIVLLLDERPEEVTDMTRHLTAGEVVSSTFDRPPEEHTAVAELTLERAKRMVEDGKDVCLMVDGISRLARAYNMSAPQSGRVLSGGVDAAALYPPKRFLGAARNLEEGGSLTILATAFVETGSKMDEVIFEEFTGTANMELRLDRRIAEKRIFPAIDLDASSTRNEDLLRSAEEVEASWKLRRVVSDMNDDGASPTAGIEMLVERLGTSKTNKEFLSEISKAR